MENALLIDFPVSGSLYVSIANMPGMKWTLCFSFDSNLNVVTSFVDFSMLVRTYGLFITTGFNTTIISL